MKKLLSTLLLITVILSMMLITGCTDPNGNNDTPPDMDGPSTDGSKPDTPGNTPAEGKETFSKGETVRILINGEIPEAATRLQNEIYEALGVMPVFITDESEAKGSELIIGTSERTAFKKAESFLEREARESKYLPRYGVYSDGDSVALIFDDCEGYDDYIVETVINNFIYDYVSANSAITVKKGSFNYGTFDILLYQESIDQAKVDVEWKKLEEKLGVNATKAFKNMYTMYSDKMINWLADLYDPDIGGFYITNSARDNEGFLPNIESTSQALDIIRMSGMIDDWDADLKAALPDWFQKALVRFVKNMQDPNGYFYHPQYSKEQTDNNVSAKSRFLTKGLDLLARLGASPTYDTPNGVKGDGIKSDGTPVSAVRLSAPLKLSVATAVSKVVAVSDASSSSPYLASTDAFKKWVNGLGINFDPYTIGNDLASMSSEIKAKGPEYVAIAKEYLDSTCLESTGHWYEKNDYMGLNGLMKIAAAYNGLGIPLPYPERNADFAIDMITTTEEEITVCYAYNTWFTVSTVKNNVDRHQPEIAAQVNARINERLYGNATELITSTFQKQLRFALSDGSFIYDFGVGGTQQGLPASIPGIHEGGVNPTLICMSETLHHMFSALGLEGYDPPIYTKVDFLRFIDRLENLGTVIKTPQTFVKYEATFDAETEGATSLEVKTAGSTSAESTFKVIQDPRPGARPGEKVLAFDAKSDGAKHVMMEYDQSQNPLNQVYVFEGEYCFMNAPTTGSFAYLNMGNECYMILFHGYADGSNGSNPTHIRLFEASSDDGKASKEMDLDVMIPLGKWFSIKIEYYIENYLDPRIKLFVNDELITVTDNYYDRSGAKLDGNQIKAKNRYEGADFLVYSYYSTLVLMDNLQTYKISTPYTAIQPGDKQPTRYNVDAPDNPEKIFDFENDTVGEAPEGLTSTGVKVESGNYITLGKGAASTIAFPINIRTRKTNDSVFSANMTFSEASVGKTLTLRFRNAGLTPNYITTFNMTVTKEADGTYALIYNAPGGLSGTAVDGGKIPVGESVEFRAEYFDILRTTLFYVNNMLIASSESTEDRAQKWTPEFVELSAPAGANVILDNVKAERVVRDFSEATKPAIDTKVYTFTSGLEDITATAGATVSGGYLNFDEGSSVQIPVNWRSVITTATFFQTEIPAAKLAAGSEFTFTLCDKDGNNLLAYVFRANDTTINVHEYTERGIYDAPLYKLTKSSKLTLNISYYAGQSMIYLTANGMVVAASNLAWNESSAIGIPGYAEIKATKGNTLQLDNLYIETYNATYSATEIPKTKNDEDTSENLTFESSSTGNIPALVRPDVKSAGSFIKISEMLNMKKEVSKVLTIGARAGYQDIVYFDMMKDESGANCYIFETDIKFKIHVTSSFQIFLEDADGNTAYRLNFHNKDSILRFKHNNSEYVEIPGAESWHNLRVEYYVIDQNNVRIKFFVDGNVIFDDNKYHSIVDGVPPITELSAIKFLTYTAASADITFDNTSYQHVVRDPDYVKPDEKIDAEILPIKGGATSIAVLVHDDGDLSSASILDSLYQKYSLKGDVAITAKRFNVANPNQAEIAGWQALLNTGRWGMINHSMTHGFWGNETTGEIDEALIEYEVLTSRDLLRKIFPTERFLVYAYPGISRVTNVFTEKVYDAVKKVVEANYIAGRYYGKGSAALYDWDWEWMPTYAINLNQQQSLAAIDTAARNGQFISILVHQVIADERIDNGDFIREDFNPNDPYWSRASHLEAICKKISEYVAAGTMWSANYEDAVLYLREAENAKLTLYRGETNITASVDDGLDDEIYNYPLTVRISVDETWEAVKVVQGDRISYAKVFTKGGNTYIDADIIPDKTDAVITQISIDDIPSVDGMTPPDINGGGEVDMGGSNKEDNGWV